MTRINAHVCVLAKALLLAAVLVVSTGGLAQAVQKNCTKELRDGHAAFMKKLRAHNFKSGAASGSGAANKRLTAWLKAEHADTVAHEKAHKKAAGKWGGKIEYLNYTWWNIPYAVAGCHKPKAGIPLEVALKSALAPKQPSTVDLRIAKELKQLIEIKKSREKCYKIGAPTSRISCLRKTDGFAWVDQYPLK